MYTSIGMRSARPWAVVWAFRQYDGTFAGRHSDGWHPLRPDDGRQNVRLFTVMVRLPSYDDPPSSVT